MGNVPESSEEQVQEHGGPKTPPCNPVTLSFTLNLGAWKKKEKNKKVQITMIEFFVPMKKIPTTTHQQKKVAVVNGKPKFYEPQKLKEARCLFLNLLAPYTPNEKIEGPIRLTVKWLFPKIKKATHGQYKTTKPDTDNLQKLLKDCMTDLEYWEDDAQVASEIAEKFWSDTVGIYVKVEEL